MLNERGPARVSAIIPTFNAARFLAETFRSVLGGVNKPREIIVADDASTDETPEIVQQFSRESDIPIRLLRMSQNSGGPAGPMNAGIEAASGDYLALLDQDDLMLPDKLQRQADVLDTHQDIELVLADYARFDERGVWENSGANAKAGSWHSAVCQGVAGVTLVEPLTALTAFAHAPGLHGGCSNMMFRRSLWEQTGGFRAQAGPAADYDFLFRAVRCPIAWIDQVLFLRREHARNLSRRDASTELIGHRVVEQWLSTEARRLPEDLVSSIRNAWTARLVMAARSARRRRDWTSYWQLRERLSQSGTPESRVVTDERIYPRWAYRAKDWLGKRLRRPMKT